MTFSLDQISLIGVYSAMAVYALAFITYAIDLARRGAAATAATDSQATPPFDRAEAGVPARSTAVTSSTAESSSPSYSAAHALPGKRDGAPWHEIDYGRSPVLRVAVALTVIAWVLHLGATVFRGVAAERVPWANMYEFALTGTLLVTTVYLLVLVITKQDLRFLGTFISGLVLVLLGAATVNFYVSVVPLPPALQSIWLIIHVFVASTAVGVFALGFALSILQLVQSRRESLLDTADTVRRSFVATLPNATTLENLAYRMNIVGFIMWTFTLMAGAVWAEQSWGRYWGWDVKEVWTFIIWVVYAGYIHARATRGWRGSRSAWLSIIGFATVLFNFTVVNMYFQGLHSYSGL